VVAAGAWYVGCREVGWLPLMFEKGLLTVEVVVVVVFCAMAVLALTAIGFMLAAYVKNEAHRRGESKDRARQYQAEVVWAGLTEDERNLVNGARGRQAQAETMRKLSPQSSDMDMTVFMSAAMLYAAPSYDDSGSSGSSYDSGSYSSGSSSYDGGGSYSSDSGSSYSSDSSSSSDSGGGSFDGGSY
jgi:uncharacterized membrane protein YgcG